MDASGSVQVGENSFGIGMLVVGLSWIESLKKPGSPLNQHADGKQVQAFSKNLTVNNLKYVYSENL